MANITGTSAADLLIGVATSGDDTVAGLEGDDLIAGEAGDDVLNGGPPGGNVLIGGTLNVTGGVGTVVLHPGDQDTASYADRVSAVFLTLSDTQTVDVTRFGISMHLSGVGREGSNGQGDILIGIENLIGGSGDDRLTGDSHDNILYGMAGRDHLVGAGGDDILAAGDGFSDEFLDGGAGADLLIEGDLAIANGVGTVIDSFYDEGKTADYRTSEAGISLDFSAAQTIDITRAGVSLHLQDAVVGHGGDAEGDVLVGGFYVEGSRFNDHLIGGIPVGYQELSGGAGDDRLERANLLRGGDGNDTLIGGVSMSGGPGADVLDGSADNNNVILYAGQAVTIDLAQGTGHGGEAEGDILIDIEVVFTTAGDDRVIGSYSDEIAINLGPGNDVTYGLGGTDTLRGGSGNDRLVGGAGGDQLYGDAGYDWVYYHTSTAGVSADLTSGGGLGGDSTSDRLSGIEAIYGSAHNDTLTGNSDTNTLIGSKGADGLRGWGRADTFMYEAVSDSTVAAAGRDVILDFSRTQGDKINLWAIDADGNAANGNTAFVYTVGGAFTGIGHQVVVQHSGTGIGTSMVSADLNGDKVADFAIEVHTAVAITGVDLVL